MKKGQKKTLKIAKTVKTTKTTKTTFDPALLEMLNPNAAGIDVASEVM